MLVFIYGCSFAPVNCVFFCDSLDFFCASFFSSGNTQFPVSSSLLHGLLLRSQLRAQIDPKFLLGGFGMQGGVFNDTWLVFYDDSKTPFDAFLNVFFCFSSIIS